MLDLMKAPAETLPLKPSPPRLILTVGLLSVVTLSTLDLVTPSRMSFAALYCLAIAFVAWNRSLAWGLVAALIASLGTALHLLSLSEARPSQTGVLVWNIASETAVFCLLGWLVAKIAKLMRHLRELLKERETQYHAVLSSAMDGFAAIRPDGTIVDVNESFCRMLGYTRQELLSMHMAQIEAKEKPKDLARHAQLISLEGADRFETRHRRKDGSEIDLEISVSRMRSGENMMLAFAREIGERKQAEARLRESEERYRTLAESSPDAIFVIDPQLRLRYVNSAAASLLQREPQELIGLTQKDLFTKDTAIKHVELAAEAFRTGQSSRFDEQIDFPAGPRWIETRLVPVLAADGVTRALIVIAIDISERKTSEMLLKLQRDLVRNLSSTSDLTAALKALLEAAFRFEGIAMAGIYLRDQVSGDLILRAHSGLRPDFVEQVSCYAADTARAEMVAKGTPVYSPYNLLPLEREHVTDKYGIRALAVIPMIHEQAVIGCLNVGSRASDSLPAQTRMGIELLAAQAAGAIGRIHAETDRQRLESQILEISDREQARIGQEIHDGLCQQLVSLAFDANSLHRDLARSGRAEARVAERITGYLDDTITQARQLSRGLFPIRLQDEGLISALEELARSTGTRFGKRCTFQCVAPGLRANTTVANNLFRIAQEAITNALKHAKPDSISVQLQATAQKILLTIDDDGIGMTSTQRLQGMGLHIMEYRARNIGGRLTIGPGSHGGTRVSCCVPCSPDENIRS